MRPAFKSTASAAIFCAMLLLLLALPFVTLWIGHPSREQAYADMLGETSGQLGMAIRTIFSDPGDADILLLGSSLLEAGVDIPTLETALSAHLGRPARIKILALNWQGLDEQYFLLRDYLSDHKAKLILWNLPAPGARNLEPHVESLHWWRFGEYSNALSGLPLKYRLAVYGEMTLGAPREILSHLRPNLLGPDEMTPQDGAEEVGYYRSAFVNELATAAIIPPIALSYQEPPYALVHLAGKPLDVYETHFARKILELGKEAHTKIVFLHIPIDSERGLDYMPERCRLVDTLHSDNPVVGITSVALFKGVDDARFLHFYRDQHFNMNGRMLFTKSILPAVLRAYDLGVSNE